MQTRACRMLFVYHAQTHTHTSCAYMQTHASMLYFLIHVKHDYPQNISRILISPNTHYKKLWVLDKRIERVWNSLRRTSTSYSQFFWSMEPCITLIFFHLNRIACPLIFLRLQKPTANTLTFCRVILCHEGLQTKRNFAFWKQGNLCVRIGNTSSSISLPPSSSWAGVSPFRPYPAPFSLRNLLNICKKEFFRQQIRVTARAGWAMLRAWEWELTCTLWHKPQTALHILQDHQYQLSRILQILPTSFAMDILWADLLLLA